MGFLVVVAALLSVGCARGKSLSDYSAEYSAIVKPAESEICSFTAFGKTNPNNAQIEQRFYDHATTVETEGNALLRHAWPAIVEVTMSELAQALIKEATLFRSFKSYTAQDFQARVSDSIQEQNALVTEIAAKLKRPIPTEVKCP